jgi:hypothetical protein
MKQQERRPADPGAAPNAGYLIDLHYGVACRTDALRWPNSTEHALVTARNAEREIPRAQRYAKMPLHPKRGEVRRLRTDPTGTFQRSRASRWCTDGAAGRAKR